jgi:two-component system LytT family response regulator
MQVKAVIIDDEQNNIDNLALMLKKHCPQVTVVDSAKNAEDGKKIILQQNPDLVFLDIQMPVKNGFDLLKSLNNYSFEIVFVTAYDQYGIAAIKFAAIDYLLKPVNTAELKSAVQKAVQQAAQKKQNLQLENLIQLLQQQQNKAEHRIALNTMKETRFVHPAEIMHCESSNNYTTFFITGGEKLIVSRPIYEYDEMLAGYGFIRCHQSHLVNKKFIKSWIKEEGGYLVLQDGTAVPVSRNKKELVKQQLDTIA